MRSLAPEGVDVFYRGKPRVPSRLIHESVEDSVAGLIVDERVTEQVQSTKGFPTDRGAAEHNELTGVEPLQVHRKVNPLLSGSETCASRVSIARPLRAFCMNLEDLTAKNFGTL